jgi:NAD(P)-dependent dehydrogenase (short-subunit alcohol dehydrogenase family)
MQTSKNTSKLIIVIGASSTIAKEFTDNPNVFFLGRSNPYNANNFIQINGLENEVNIQDCSSKIQLLLEQNNYDEVHLVCLQGISNNNWNKSMMVNLISCGVLSETFCNFLTDNKKCGSVTFIGSVAQVGGKKLTYSATKSALVGLMNSVNENYGQFVRANIIIPSVFESKMIEDWNKEKRKNVSDSLYSKRFVTTKEIAHAIEFCIDNSYIQGSLLNQSSGGVKII